VRDGGLTGADPQQRGAAAGHLCWLSSIAILLTGINEHSPLFFGEIMQTVRHVIQCFVLAACAVILQGCASPVYKVAIVAGPGSAALGINEHGHTVGYLAAGAGQHAFVNSGAGPADLGTLGGINSRAWGINGAGRIAGQSEIAGGANRAFVADGGALVNLGTLGGADSIAQAVNGDGTIVGSSRIADGEWRAFSYSSGAMANLGTLPSTDRLYSYGRAINNRGQIAGISTAGLYLPPENPQHAFLRRTSGLMDDLGTFGGQYSEAFGINEYGEVVGVAATPELHADNAFLYSGGVLHDLGNLGGGYAQAFDINNKHEVVGVSGGSTPPRGFLYRKGAMVALDTLVGGGWTVTDARAINDHSQIAGTGCLAGLCYAVRLDPAK
jgi:probable HAF family extracellular repeat protein